MVLVFWPNHKDITTLFQIGVYVHLNVLKAYLDAQGCGIKVFLGKTCAPEAAGISLH